MVLWWGSSLLNGGIHFPGAGGVLAFLQSYGHILVSPLALYPCHRNLGPLKQALELCFCRGLAKGVHRAELEGEEYEELEPAHPGLPTVTQTTCAEGAVREPGARRSGRHPSFPV